MRRFLLAGLLALTAFAGARDDMKVWFVYFMRGDGPRPTDKAELEAMQAAHIKNLGDIVKNFHGLAAGPLNDPTKERRGIMVLQAKDEAEVKRAFEPDPYVKNKIMGTQAMVWEVDPKVFKTSNASDKELSEFRLVVFKPGRSLQPVNEKIMKEHREYLDSLRSSQNLRVQGAVSSPLKIRDLAIFESKDDEAIRKALEMDPLVQRSLLEVEIIPLWMGKGIFGN